ncbi:DAK2 domain-containing protein [Alkalicoccobacillus murimartini]|uniref:Dihydroxyacetone kinase-like protein n=1 Tax=Alkalicoccobacillus murimartini TaxID=171685 RepID=A0ABT9YI18_9BACI|nr:DAK2 domain-containing protein [Alkalicoccobacillus murimartini]MDQ0207166.1 dihydroxyacetone kinase-like protein [Alkalicoccobacillus murimartini]
MEFFTSDVAKSWFRISTQELFEVNEYLSLLDKDVGDGDHGQHVANGFSGIKSEELQKLDTLEQIFEYVGQTLKTESESSSIPLYGEAFMEMSDHLNGKDVSITQFGEALQAAVEKMKEVGQTKRGDKTLVDVWSSVADSIQSKDHPSSLVFEDAAKSALKSSKRLVAQKGQASEYGSNSVGFLDPGIVSSYHLFLSLTKAFEQGNQ